MSKPGISFEAVKADLMEDDEFRQNMKGCGRSMRPFGELLQMRKSGL
ncbi:MAG: hypothetical protein LUI39_02945 [Lachnospiraceae bacterium]|nr:hypothetical protein [Lachnospiraceae bacterium]